MWVRVNVYVRKKKWSVDKVHQVLTAELEAKAGHVLRGCGIRVVVPPFQ